MTSTSEYFKKQRHCGKIIFDDIKNVHNFQNPIICTAGSCRSLPYMLFHFVAVHDRCDGR